MEEWDAIEWWRRHVYMSGELGVMRLQADMLADALSGGVRGGPTAAGASTPVDRIEHGHAETLDRLEESGIQVRRLGEG